MTTIDTCKRFDLIVVPFLVSKMGRQIMRQSAQLDARTSISPVLESLRCC
jgi:hypothetical protein